MKNISNNVEIVSRGGISNSTKFKMPFEHAFSNFNKSVMDDKSPRNNCVRFADQDEEEDDDS